MERFLCIDAGTTNLKAALLTSEGEIVCTGDMPVDVMRNGPGFSETDMEKLWLTVCGVLKKMREITKEDYWQTIAGIAVAGQGEGGWLVDQDNRPVRPAILWNDTRRSSIPPKQLKEAETLCRENSCSPLYSGSHPIILHWIRENEPDVYSKIGKVLRCKDWINYKFTDRMISDETDSSTAVFNIFNKTYVPDILDALGLPEIKDCLPEVVPSTTVIGCTTQLIEQVLGIRQGTPVVAGMLDMISVSAGNGIIDAGDKGIVLGTTLGNFIVLNEKQSREIQGSDGSLLCNWKPNTYFRQMSALSGAATLDWIRNQFGENVTFSNLEKMISGISIGSEGLTFLPYISGERAPFKNPDASASFTGVRIAHSAAHFVRAVYEGLMMSLLDCQKNLPVSNEEIKISGGAAKSDMICQMVSDCLGKTVFRSDFKEAGILGLLSLWGLDPTRNTQSQTSGSKQKFTPNLENTVAYQRLYDRYIEIKNALAPTWH